VTIPLSYPLLCLLTSCVIAPSDARLVPGTPHRAILVEGGDRSRRGKREAARVALRARRETQVEIGAWSKKCPGGLFPKRAKLREIDSEGFSLDPVSLSPLSTAKDFMVGQLAIRLDREAYQDETGDAHGSRASQPRPGAGRAVDKTFQA
jgi:hypothetical protein